MAKQSGDELVLYKTPVWVFPGYILAIGGVGLFMWAGAESKWMLLFAGIGVMIVGIIVVWLQKLHRRSWARQNQMPE